ncbi:DUF4350 domain-containing protein [Seonamhaeicola marinus]|uniref:DUF4350 domain-containing protein n=1 Tax=Seonamhaeicola marinus TaxID=1912246 RepID=A0A5D0IPI5_9FLAO|nr:DUF4350 domain-containing protein [Seonamhaeicola marinus]TYA84277.1 DUF4350 domain-containing protein [Seonamhaeicola marinus]
MKKSLPVILVIVALVIVGAFTIKIKRTRTIDWEESFNEKSSKPYGINIFYKELPKLFRDKKIRTVYHQPSSYLAANSEDGWGDHVAQGSYIKVGNSDYLTEYSVDEVLNFVSNGNTLFISDYYFHEKLEDTLGIEIKFEYNPKKDSISELSFTNKSLNYTKIDKNSGDNYFSKFDSINHSILGHSKTDEKRVNFIHVPFKNGSIYLHLQPKVFTNYNLLKGDRYKYVESLISYLPDDNIYFDSYSKYQNSYDGDVEQESDLSWFLDQLAFRWAWYTAVIFGILFMIFNAKRRQRIIKIITPLQNTSVAFVKTISNLYFETKDYKNLIDKKITYFFEKVRSDYNLDTEELNEEFITKLAAKAGKKKEDVKTLINYIKLIQSKREYYEDNLVKLNKYIENFYA